MYSWSLTLVLISSCLVSIRAVVLVSDAIEYQGIGCGTMCCSGRNNTCASTGVRINGKGLPAGRCFCDQGCINMGDCCFDHANACKVDKDKDAVDCVVSDWSEYTACSQECGLGVKVRQRAVLVAPQNGGKECPNFRETNTCMGTKCLRTRHHGANAHVERETARIMPAIFAKYRKLKQYNANMDIRKNLFDQYYYNTTQIKSTGYCSRFRLTTARISCLNYNVRWANILKGNTVVCVECQQTAMEREQGDRCTGHGSEDTVTYWNAVNAPGCNGWWIRVGDDQASCSCSGDSPLDFIYV